MKNKFQLLKHAFLITGVAFTLSSCEGENNNENQDAKDIAEEHNEAKFNKDKEKDAQLLVDVADLSQQEVRASELAAKQAVNAKVKAFAAKIVTEHNKMNQDLQALASKKQITLPADANTENADSEKEYNDLSAKNGNEFDVNYCDLMVEGHKESIEKLDKASTEAVDPEIRSFATAHLPAMRTHLDEAMQLQKTVKENKKENSGTKAKKSTATEKKHSLRKEDKPVDGTTGVNERK